jgi:hypothetical protein
MTMVVWLKGFTYDHQARLVASMARLLEAHGIADLKDGAIVISGRPGDFTIELGTRTYRGRLGVRNFDPDLYNLLMRFGDWLEWAYPAPVPKRRSVPGARSGVRP